mgnify:CR=1 FL=1
MQQTPDAFTPEQLLDLREKGRPRNTSYPIPEDQTNMEADHEDDQSLQQKSVNTVEGKQHIQRGGCVQMYCCWGEQSINGI